MEKTAPLHEMQPLTSKVEHADPLRVLAVAPRVTRVMEGKVYIAASGWT